MFHIVPAYQRFRAVETLLGYIVFRLIKEVKIAFFQRAFHFRLDICLHAIILVQAFVVRDIRGRRRLFMCQLRKVRLIEQGVDVNRFGGEYVIYAYTEQTEEIIFAERGVMIDQLADQRQAGRNLRFDLVPQKQHKPVARKMSVSFFCRTEENIEEAKRLASSAISSPK